MRTLTIKTNANQEIALTIFGSASHGNVLLIAPATGVKQTFYQSFAHYVSEQGITVVTFDYHGIGKSLTHAINKVQTTAEQWGSDNLEAVIQFARENFSGGNIYLMGHSIGGQLIGLAPSTSLARKIILVSAQSGYWKFWQGIDRIKLWSYWNVVFPSLCGLFGYLPSRSFSKMENLPKGVATQWSKWCTSPNYLFDSVQPQQLHFNSVTSEIVSYSVEGDDLAPRASVDWLTAAYKNARVRRIHLDSSLYGTRLGHFGFFNSRLKETLWADLLKKELS